MVFGVFPGNNRKGLRQVFGIWQKEYLQFKCPYDTIPQYFSIEREGSVLYQDKPQ